MFKSCRNFELSEDFSSVIIGSESEFADKLSAFAAGWSGAVVGGGSCVASMSFERLRDLAAWLDSRLKMPK